MARSYKDVEIETDEDGAWGYTKPGYCNSDGPSHTFHEDTIGELKRAIREHLKPCNCSDCQHDLKK